MMRPIERVHMNQEKLDALLERARTGPLSDEDCAKLKGVIETLSYVTDLLEDRKTTIQKLRQILFGVSTEKTSNLVKAGTGQSAVKTGQAESGPDAGSAGGQPPAAGDRPKGHGRNGALSYVGATKVKISHESLKPLGEVYKNDALAKKQGMTAQERLAFHQAHSGPRMEELEKWLKDQIAERKTEPNSGLGKAIYCWKNHWKALTLFLRVAGAPLDNNICERGLKKAILHRKNAMFFKTPHGAQVGDVFMSLIHTCELGGADPFDYLTQLQRHAEDVFRNPKDWMPWNYRESLQRSRGDPSTPG
jgi:transposase